MLKCSVDMYGLPLGITDLTSVEIELAGDVHLKDIVAALKRKVPALEGQVILPGQDCLAGNYLLNIDGKLHASHTEDEARALTSLKDGDRIALLPLSSGG